MMVNRQTRKSSKLAALVLAVAAMFWGVSPVQAEWSDPGSFSLGGNGVVLVRFLQVEANGVYVAFSNQPFTSVNCANSNPGWYALGGTADTVTKMLSLLTAAQLSHKTVKVFRSGACNASNYTLITGVILNP